MSLTIEQLEFLENLYQVVQDKSKEHQLYSSKRVDQYIKPILSNQQKLIHFNNFMNLISELSYQSNDLFPLDEDLDKKWHISLMLADIVIYTDDKLVIWQMLKDIVLQYDVVDINVIENNVILKAFDV